MPTNANANDAVILGFVGSQNYPYDAQNAKTPTGIDQKNKKVNKTQKQNNNKGDGPMVSLTEIKALNKAIGGHFFDKGKGRVLSTVYKGKYLVSQTNDKEGWLIFRAEPNGRITHVDNPNLEYGWKPISLSEAKKFARSL